MMGKIVGLRSSRQTRTPQPGVTSRVFRTSYIVVLEPVYSSTFQDVVTFLINEELYRSLCQGAMVQVSYAPNLHYVYALKQVDEGRK